ELYHTTEKETKWMIEDCIRVGDLSCDSNGGFFFFQAEDGIRDPLVTGVQTCALPISSAATRGPCGSPRWATGSRRKSEERPVTRSEERRVGKECRRRWTPCG